MTIYLPALAGTISSVVAIAVLQVAGYEPPTVPVIAVVMIVVMLLYHYSPLPDDNGTYWGREPYMQKWGFTSEPRSENK